MDYSGRTCFGRGVTVGEAEEGQAAANALHRCPVLNRRFETPAFGLGSDCVKDPLSDLVDRANPVNYF